MSARHNRTPLHRLTTRHTLNALILARWRLWACYCGDCWVFTYLLCSSSDDIGRARWPPARHILGL